jgi:hypothetical protein
VSLARHFVHLLSLLLWGRLCFYFGLSRGIVLLHRATTSLSGTLWTFRSRDNLNPACHEMDVRVEVRL